MLVKFLKKSKKSWSYRHLKMLVKLVKFDKFDQVWDLGFWSPCDYHPYWFRIEMDLHTYRNTFEYDSGRGGSRTGYFGFGKIVPKFYQKLTNILPGRVWGLAASTRPLSLLISWCDHFVHSYGHFRARRWSGYCCCAPFGVGKILPHHKCMKFVQLCRLADSIWVCSHKYLHVELFLSKRSDSDCYVHSPNSKTHTW